MDQNPSAESRRVFDRRTVEGTTLSELETEESRVLKERYELKHS